MKTFLVLGAAFGLIGVALGAFGSHGLRSRLASERLGAFETRGPLSDVARAGSVRRGDRRCLDPDGREVVLHAGRGRDGLAAARRGLVFIAGIVLFFQAACTRLALTGHRTSGAVTPFGGACLLLGWASLLFAIVVK
jgi:uncharacterized membrane protein YgdD (TMEM256/DUF423 family)